MLAPEAPTMRQSISPFIFVLAVLTFASAEGCAREKAGTASVSPAAHASPGTPSSTGKLEPYSCGTVERLHTWNGIFAGSQPAEQDLRHAKENGIKTILNLRPKTEDAGFDEAKLVGELGMDYHNVPFASPAELTDAVFEQSRALLRDESKRPIFVHCHSGNRVGAIWVAFRVLDGGLAWDAALAEAKDVGLKSPTLEQRAKEYVEHVRGTSEVPH
jgi:uncharacterized protein (TIGR01244 family)